MTNLGDERHRKAGLVCGIRYGRRQKPFNSQAIEPGALRIFWYVGRCPTPKVSGAKRPAFFGLSWQRRGWRKGQKNLDLGSIGLVGMACETNFSGGQSQWESKKQSPVNIL